MIVLFNRNGSLKELKQQNIMMCVKISTKFKFEIIKYAASYHLAQYSALTQMFFSLRPRCLAHVQHQTIHGRWKKLKFVKLSVGTLMYLFETFHKIIILLNIYYRNAVIHNLTVLTSLVRVLSVFYQ